MAKKCWVVKANLPPKFKSRVVRRCSLCGRSRAVYRKFGICRICLRKKALLGEIPGMRKASW
jgi:small subunit ribosomal protein S14